MPGLGGIYVDSHSGKVMTIEGFLRFLCVDKVTGASFGDGDSGASVFFPQAGSQPACAIGILSSGGATFDSSGEDPLHLETCVAGCHCYFSEWLAIEDHLDRYFSGKPAGWTGWSNSLSMSIDGPNTDWQGAHLSCTATVSNGTGPYTYQWYGWKGSLSSYEDALHGTPYAAGTLHLFDWDSADNFGQVHVDDSWCGNEPC